MERQDESAEEWAARSLDDSERYQRDSERDSTLSAISSVEHGSTGGPAVLVAFLLSIGRRLYHLIRKADR
jgi:hypothetical protein